MKFTGSIFSRSSMAGAKGPPGESEILALNPQRETAILEATDWSQLAPGSLNLRVGSEVVDALCKYQRSIDEPGSSVHYPPGYEHIPELRQGYWYYKAIVSKGNNRQECLVRRAINAIPDRVELFAPINMTSKWALNDDDTLTVEILEPALR